LESRVNTLGEKVGDDGAIKTTRTVDDVSSLSNGRDGIGGSGDLGIKPDFGDGVFRHGLTVEFVFTFKGRAVFGLKEDVTGLESNRDGSALKVNTKESF